MIISLIAAVSENGVIGMDETIPWNIPGEQKRFKELTLGKTVIMGRKTYDSIGRPLPDRRTIIVTRSRSLQSGPCLTAGSLDEALRLARQEEEVLIAGGGQIYEAALPYADRLYLTIVHRQAVGNIYFPAWDRSLYTLTYERPVEGSNPYTYYTFERIKGTENRSDEPFRS
ncbi:Dihydrofolate reductase type 3 [Paenibacillus konkukensis]|uniref:Dihydrofolate reductase n=1 Tax=Paenibacillus konkukensis TaxID=2020716 RepID=A0ABY4RM03_9BACL|nr:dihydrofolate reductase [Paenibacillus konkukensis]UQZ83250.1 Dihydrofolate reductase type 3 [Paenibacillus konkukensis]